MSLRFRLLMPVPPDGRRPLCAPRSLVPRASAALAWTILLAAPAMAGSGTTVTGAGGGGSGGGHASGGHTSHSSGARVHAPPKTPQLHAPTPRVIVYQANRSPNGLTRYSGVSAIARDTSAPMQSRPVLHPLRPGTFSALTVHNPNATVNFQVLVVGGQRTIVPDGLAHQPKSFAVKPGDLPLPKFGRLEYGGIDTAIQSPFNQINFHSPEPPPIQTKFIFTRDPRWTPEGASSLFAGGGPQPMSEFDDLYQFLGFAAFFAAVGALIYGGIRAANRALA